MIGQQFKQERYYKQSSNKIENMEKSNTRGSNWSVKQPNELSLVVESRVPLDSPCSTASSKLVSKHTSQKSNVKVIAEVSNRLAALKKTSPKRKQKQQRLPRSSFFQFNTIQSKTRAPTLPPSRAKQKEKLLGDTICSQEPITNSHLPVKALNYLQIVDEPGADNVIQKFRGHSFQDQFRQPLRMHQRTLFKSHVRDQAKRDGAEKQESSNSNEIQEHHQQSGWRATSRNIVRRAQTMEHAMQESIQCNSPSNLASRDPLEDTRARPFHDGSEASATTQHRVHTKHGKSVSFVPPKHQIASSVVALQDSIESMMGPTFGIVPIDASKLNLEQKMKVKELWYYNIDRANYRPYFHERIDEQMKRKEKFVQRKAATATDQNNSVFSRSSAPNNRQRLATETTVGDELAVGANSTVIGSAFKMRDFNVIKLGHLRKNSQGGAALLTVMPSTTKHQMTTGPEFQELHHETRSSSIPLGDESGIPKDYEDSFSNVKAQVARQGRHHRAQPLKMSKRVQKDRSVTAAERGAPGCSEIDDQVKGPSQETQTVLIDSNCRSKQDSYAPSPLPRDTNNSMKLSNSASVQEASLMNMPLNSKINTSEIQSPLEPERPLAAKSHLSAKVDGASLKLSKASKTKGNIAEVKNNGPGEAKTSPKGQKVLLSGSMTIKKSNEALQKQQVQQVVGQSTRLDNQDYVEERGGGVKVINHSKHKAEMKGLSTEELSMKNLNKIDSSVGSENSLPKDSIEEQKTAQLAVIEQPKAHVRTSQEYVLARDSAADYEEFRQAGIISTKFSSVKDQSHRDSTSVAVPLEAKHVVPRVKPQEEYVIQSQCEGAKEAQQNDSQDQNSPRFLQNKLVEASSTSAHHHESHNLRLLRQKIEKIRREGGSLRQQNAELIEAYHDTMKREEECLKEGTPEYIITHYSLPKALQRTVKSTGYKTRAYSQQADRQRLGFLKPLASNTIEDVEQFTYEREAKQTLAGPLGRKLSKPMACRLQHHLNKRRANFNHRMSDYQANKSLQQQQDLMSEVSFREPQKKKKQQQQQLQQQQSTDETTNGNQTSQPLSVQQVISCQGRTFEIQQTQNKRSNFQERMLGKQQKSVSTSVKPVNRSTLSKDDANNNDLVTNENDDAFMGKSHMHEDTIKVSNTHVPRLQLNRVDLQLFGNDYGGTSGRTNLQLTPLLYGHPKLNPWHPQFVKGGAQSPPQRFQLTTFLSNHLPQDTSTRTTKMISIDVQTEAKKQQQHMQQDLMRQSKMNIVMQEKSLQDTLYDAMNQELLASQKWMMSNGGLDDPAKIRMSDKMHVGGSKQICSVQIRNKASGSTVDYQAGSPPIVEDTDLVNTGDRADTDEGRRQNLQMTAEWPKTGQSTTPGTILVSREGLGEQLKQPTSEVTIPAMINVCDSTRSDAVKQHSQVFHDKQQETQDYENQKSTVRVGVRQHEDIEATPPSDNQPSVTMPNKYQLTSEMPNLDTQQKEHSLRTLHSRNQYSKLNADLPQQAQKRNLNVIVKTSSKPVQIVSRTQNDNNNVRESTPSMIDEDPAFSTQRQRYYLSNKNTPLDTAARMRYSSDRDCVVGALGQSQKSHLVNRQTIQTIQTNSLGPDERESLAKKLRGPKVNESYESSEYVSLKLKNMDPEAQGIENQQPSSNGLRASIDKTTTIFKLQAMYGSPITELRQGARSRRKHGMFQESERHESICSQASKTRTKSQQSSIEDSKESSTMSQQKAIRRRESVDPHWLEKYIQLQNKHQQRHNDRELHIARQERILASKTAHLSKQTSRQRTPPISRNKLLQVPLKPHKWAKVSSVGNTHANVEQIWAKTRSNMATLSPRRGSGKRLRSK